MLQNIQSGNTCRTNKKGILISRGFFYGNSPVSILTSPCAALDGSKAECEKFWKKEKEFPDRVFSQFQNLGLRGSMNLMLCRNVWCGCDPESSRAHTFDGWPHTRARNHDRPGSMQKKQKKYSEEMHGHTWRKKNGENKKCAISLCVKLQGSAGLN